MSNNNHVLPFPKTQQKEKNSSTMKKCFHWICIILSTGCILWIITLFFQAEPASPVANGPINVAFIVPEKDARTTRYNGYVGVQGSVDGPIQVVRFDPTAQGGTPVALHVKTPSGWHRFGIIAVDRNWKKPAKVMFNYRKNAGLREQITIQNHTCSYIAGMRLPDSSFSSPTSPLKGDVQWIEFYNLGEKHDAVVVHICTTAHPDYIATFSGGMGEIIEVTIE